MRLSRDMDSTSIMELNVIRERFVTEVRSLAEGFAGKKKTVAEYSRCLYEFIVQSRVQVPSLLLFRWTYCTKGRVSRMAS